MINFPTGVPVDTTVAFGTQTWKWNGVGWQKVPNGGQVGSAMVELGPEIVTQLTTLPSPAFRTSFIQINYV